MLSEIFQELLTNRDDYLRALRTLLREIMRAVRHDMNFTAFALGLMKERNEPKFKNMEAQHKVLNILLQVLVNINPPLTYNPPLTLQLDNPHPWSDGTSFRTVLYLKIVHKLQPFLFRE